MIESIYEMNLSLMSWLTSDKGITGLILVGCLFSCFFYSNLEEKHPFWKKNLFSFLKGFSASMGVVVSGIIATNFVYFFNQLGFYYNSKIYTWTNLSIILVVLAMFVNYAFYSERTKSSIMSKRSKWIGLGTFSVILVSTTIGYMNADEKVRDLILFVLAVILIGYLWVSLFLSNLRRQ